MNIDQALNDDFHFMSESLNFLMSFRLFIKRFSLGKKKNQLTLLSKSKSKSNRDHGIVNVSGNEKMLYIEISAEKINSLLAQRMICAADVRCLDASSKHCLKELCLTTCLYNKQSYQPGSQLLGNLIDSPLQIKNYD